MKLMMDFDFIQFPLPRLETTKGRGMIGERRGFLFKLGSFCDAAQANLQLVPVVSKVLPFAVTAWNLAIPARLGMPQGRFRRSLSSTGEGRAQARIGRGPPAIARTVALALDVRSDQPPVPPTVMRSIRRVGWPTPTGTPWPFLPQVPMPVSSARSLPTMVTRCRSVGPLPISMAPLTGAPTLPLSMR